MTEKWGSERDRISQDAAKKLIGVGGKNNTKWAPARSDHINDMRQGSPPVKRTEISIKILKNVNNIDV